MKLSLIAVPAFIMLVVFCLGINPGTELLLADDAVSLEACAALESEKLRDETPTDDPAIESNQLQYSGLITRSCIRVRQCLSGKYHTLRFADIRGSPLLTS